jgi:hypothetical protein
VPDVLCCPGTYPNTGPSAVPRHAAASLLRVRCRRDRRCSLAGSVCALALSLSPLPFAGIDPYSYGAMGIGLSIGLSVVGAAWSVAVLGRPSHALCRCYPSLLCADAVGYLCSSLSVCRGILLTGSTLVGAALKSPRIKSKNLIRSVAEAQCSLRCPARVSALLACCLHAQRGLCLLCSLRFLLSVSRRLSPLRPIPHPDSFSLRIAAVLHHFRGGVFAPAPAALFSARPLRSTV